MLKSIYLSPCKMFRATEINDHEEYTIIRRKDEETVGWAYMNNNRRWIFDTLLEHFTAPELLDLSALMGIIRNDFYNDETFTDEDNS